MLSDRLREQRRETKHTQDSLAKILGVSQQTIGSWEIGRTSPDKDMLKNLAKVFNCSVDWLLNKTIEDFRFLLVRIMRENSLSLPELAAILQIDKMTISGIIEESTTLTYNQFKAIISKLIELAQSKDTNTILTQYFFDITPFATDFYKNDTGNSNTCDDYKETDKSDPVEVAINFIESCADPIRAKRKITKNATVSIPIIGTVKAGLNGISFEEHLGYYNALTDSLPSGSPSYCLKVRGDSMSPYLLPDDLVLFQENPDVPSGSLAIVIVDGEEGTVKWLKRGEGFIRLEAENPYYPPREFSGDELQEIRIVGPVIEVIRKPVKKNGFISK